MKTLEVKCSVFNYFEILRHNFDIISLYASQSNRSSRSKDKRPEKQPSEEEINEQPKDKGFENYIASLANDNDGQDDAENGHDDTIKNHNDSRHTNGSYPLPGFEENGLDNNDDQNFDHRDQIESNALQNGYREQGMNRCQYSLKD